METMEKEIMTTEEVARYLRLTEATVYKLAQAGDIPAAKLGRTWRFKRDLIDEWFRLQGSMPEDSDQDLPETSS
jgi:excisionase family DNA binding protein